MPSCVSRIVRIGALSGPFPHSHKPLQVCISATNAVQKRRKLSTACSEREGKPKGKNGMTALVFPHFHIVTFDCPQLEED